MPFDSHNLPGIVDVLSRGPSLLPSPSVALIADDCGRLQYFGVLSRCFFDAARRADLFAVVAGKDVYHCRHCSSTSFPTLLRVMSPSWEATVVAVADVAPVDIRGESDDLDGRRKSFIK